MDSRENENKKRGTENVIGILGTTVVSEEGKKNVEEEEDKREGSDTFSISGDSSANSLYTLHSDSSVPDLNKTLDDDI
jgi:cysteine sulfinate desulfinase/cysteine desulfurase-like protein